MKLVLKHQLTALSRARQKAPDLIVKRILDPEECDSTKITVVIKNKGNLQSQPVKLRIWDVDIDTTEAKKIGVKEEQMWLFKENMERAKDGNFDYDYDYEFIISIPALKKKEEYIVTVYVKHWVYDSNCEIGAFIDCDEELKEKNETNNKAYFFEGG